MEGALYVAGLAVLIWGSSSLMLRYPHLLKKQKHRPFYNVRTIAHRGGRETTPENTMAAFVAGWKHCDAVELDVWLTADGVVVVHHDKTFDRVSGIGGKVTETAYADLPRVLCRPSDGHEQGAKEFGDKKFAIPTLVEVLDRLPVVLADGRAAVLNIEFKQDSQQLVDKVHAMLVERDLHGHGRVVWFSLKWRIQKRLKAKDPEIPTITGVAEMLTILGCHFVGVLPLVDLFRSDAKLGFNIIGFDAKPITIEKARRNLPVLAKAPPFVQRIIVGAVNSLFGSKSVYRYFRGRGVPVLAMGVNDAQTFARAVELGATGVLTDDVEWLATECDSSKLARVDMASTSFLSFFHWMR